MRIPRCSEKILIILLGISFLLSSIGDVLFGLFVIFGRQFSRGDFLSFVLLLVSLYFLLKRKWKITRIGLLWLLFIGSLLFSGIINDTMSSGSYLNFLRTFVFFFSSYIVSYNVFKSSDNISFFENFFMLVAIILCIFFWSIRQEVIYTDLRHDYLRWPIFLNNVGRNFSILYGITLIKIKRNISFISSLVLIFLLISLLFCFSRFVYIVIILMTMAFCIDIRIKLKYAVLVICLIAVIGHSVNLMNEYLTDKEQKIVLEKRATLKSDAIDIRLTKINLNIIKDFMDSEHISNLLVGHGITEEYNIYQQHSFYPFVLTITGIFGGLIIMFYYIVILKIAMKFMRWKINYRQFLLGILLICIILSDFVNNARSHNVATSTLYAIVTGLVVSISMHTMGLRGNSR